jgi:hypothetical protein
MEALKKKPGLVILSIVVLGVLIFKFGTASLPREQWILYKASEAAPIAEFVSYEACSSEQQKLQEPSGCRRVDAPFNLLNKIADAVFR